MKKCLSAATGECGVHYLWICTELKCRYIWRTKYDWIVERESFVNRGKWWWCVGSLVWWLVRARSLSFTNLALSGFLSVVLCRRCIHRSKSRRATFVTATHSYSRATQNLITESVSVRRFHESRVEYWKFIQCEHKHFLLLYRHTKTDIYFVIGINYDHFFILTINKKIFFNNFLGTLLIQGVTERCCRKRLNREIYQRMICNYNNIK